MIKVAITGGIGTGKTTILCMFADKGIPVFNSDEIASEIMNTNPLLKNEIITAFGDKAYDKNKLNKKYLSNVVFNNKTLLILADSNKNILLSSRNLKKTKVVNVSSINTYDLMNANKLMFVESSIKEIEKNYKN